VKVVRGIDERSVAVSLASSDATKATGEV
jgi:hypothetical protein